MALLLHAWCTQRVVHMGCSLSFLCANFLIYTVASRLVAAQCTTLAASTCLTRQASQMVSLIQQSAACLNLTEVACCSHSYIIQVIDSQKVIAAKLQRDVSIILQVPLGHSSTDEESSAFPLTMLDADELALQMDAIMLPDGETVSTYIMLTQCRTLCIHIAWVYAGVLSHCFQCASSA